MPLRAGIFACSLVKIVNLLKNQLCMEILLTRITLNPAVCHGKPTIRNKRYPVELILDLLASGMTHNEILADYPTLEEADILACLLYAAKLTRVKSIQKALA